MCVCVSVSTLLNINISATSMPVGIKFLQKRYWGSGKAAVGFRPVRIGTLVSMATDSSHKVLMGKML